MAESIKAILVDDERSARDVLESLLSRFCPSVEILEKHENLPDAVRAVKLRNPDIVFLDIEMPHYAGHEILSFFDEIDFEIIFVTAYDSYAVKAFEVAAVDYLLKPVDIDRLQEAVQKATEKIKSKSVSREYKVLAESLRSDRVHNIVITEAGDQHVVPVADIVAIEAQESYSTVITAERIYTASKNLKHFERLLADNPNFFRSHKSWIINRDFLMKYNKTSGDIQLAHDVVAKLSKYRKEEFEAVLQAS